MHIFFLSCLSSFCFVFILYPLYFEFPVHFPFGVLISFLVHECPDTPAEIRRLQIHPIHPLRGFAIQAWSVFTKITVVFFALVLDA